MPPSLPPPFTDCCQCKAILSLPPMIEPALSLASFSSVWKPRYFWKSLAYWATTLQALFSCFSGISRIRTPPSTSMLTCLWDTGYRWGKAQLSFIFKVCRKIYSLEQFFAFADVAELNKKKNNKGLEVEKWRTQIIFCWVYFFFVNLNSWHLNLLSN